MWQKLGKNNQVFLIQWEEGFMNIRVFPFLLSISFWWPVRWTIYNTGKSSYVVLVTNISVLFFNWNHFEMRLLNLRINSYLWRTFVLIFGRFLFFVLFLLSLRFGQISPLAFFRWFTATSDRNDESCNRIPSNYCLP